jgi:ABC-2 type transport system permease protein
MSAALTLWNKHMYKSMTSPEEAIGMLIQPILWVVLFGVGMGSLLGATEPGAEDSYITFMLPVPGSANTTNEYLVWQCF